MPPTPLDHVGKDRLRHPEQAQRVDRKGRLDLLVRDLEQAAPADHTGVVDQNVDRPAGSTRLRRDRVDALAVRHVADEAARCFAPARVQLGDDTDLGRAMHPAAHVDPVGALTARQEHR